MYTIHIYTSLNHSIRRATKLWNTWLTTPLLKQLLNPFRFKTPFPSFFHPGQRQVCLPCLVSTPVSHIIIFFVLCACVLDNNWENMQHTGYKELPPDYLPCQIIFLVLYACVLIMRSGLRMCSTLVARTRLSPPILFEQNQSLSIALSDLVRATGKISL